MLLHMVAGGSADEHPLQTMGDFVNPARNPSGTRELFFNAILLVDIALLDYQAIEYWPSELDGAALLLVDPALDFMSVAQLMQLDANILWECKSWLYAVTYGVSYMEAMSSQAEDHWAQVASEELMFIQSQVVVPRHLARGLGVNETATGEYNNQWISSARISSHFPNCVNVLEELEFIKRFELNNYERHDETENHRKAGGILQGLILLESDVVHTP
ncbi:hypothetical protein PsorP6_010087 [Peronosclerospora sorghi]|uniref:Uncharacterized protein n=1 Tax=Peronosclerospora sorghi TaxID=230839 RepID=A0ACC0VV02_9STRA|nr:hypothetical protein PsorP6_010087 [Peronosclerospora sorghi]